MFKQLHDLVFFCLVIIFVLLLHWSDYSGHMFLLGAYFPNFLRASLRPVAKKSNSSPGPWWHPAPSQGIWGNEARIGTSGSWFMERLVTKSSHVKWVCVGLKTGLMYSTWWSCKRFISLTAITPLSWVKWPNGPKPCWHCLTHSLPALKIKTRFRGKKLEQGRPNCSWSFLLSCLWWMAWRVLSFFWGRN